MSRDRRSRFWIARGNGLASLRLPLLAFLPIVAVAQYLGESEKGC
jgi:hypothetical protein